MALIPIVIYGDPVLREKSREMTQDQIDEQFREHISNMAETMYDAAGIGLAANQIGDARRYFLADWAQATEAARRGGKRAKDPKRRELHVFINPLILETSLEDEEGNEGCLSIPEIEADVFRYQWIKVRYRDLDWEEHEAVLEGLAARVFQHELDHLDGVLFIDRLPEPERVRLAGQLRKLKKKTEEVSAGS